MLQLQHISQAFSAHTLSLTTAEKITMTPEKLENKHT